MAAKYELKKTSNGEYLFNLKAGNGESIGRSEMYSSTAARGNGIQSVKSNGPTAPVTDPT